MAAGDRLDDRRGESRATAQRYRFYAPGAQLFGRIDAAGRRIPDGLSAVFLGRTRGHAHHRLDEHVAVGRRLAAWVILSRGSARLFRDWPLIKTPARPRPPGGSSR